MILAMALSAVGAGAAGETAGPPCSATVKDHCMEGAAGSAGAAKSHKHAVRHGKHKPATAKPAVAAKPAASAKPAPAKPSAAPHAKPKAK
jgi:hypothetical protein